MKNCNSILNKITVDNYEKLGEKLISSFSSDEIIDGVINLIFDKALEQQKFVKTYADLCAGIKKNKEYGDQVSYYIVLFFPNYSFLSSYLFFSL